MPLFPCHRHPHLCKAPFNCNQSSMSQFSMQAVGGHANLQSWCMPSAWKYANTLVKQCLVNKDLRQSGLEVFDMQVRTKTGELDGSYCFIEGHCSNAAINDNTTLEEAEKVCDRRYGHAGWAGNYILSDGFGLGLKLALDAVTGKGLLPALASEKGGFKEQKITRVFAKAACSMGNFHCDVQYCKHTFCQIEHYRRKYAHLVPPVSGQDIIDLSPL